MSNVQHRIGIGFDESEPIDGEASVVTFAILDNRGRAILDQNGNFLIDQNGT